MIYFTMYKFIFTAIILFGVHSAFAQKEITTDASGNKILKGFITQQDLSKDSSFTWYASNAKGYTPEATAVAGLKTAKDSIHILAFGGTWCDDTKTIFPKFFAITDAAAFPQERITILGVDRDKKTVNHLSEAFNVTLVPTFIVLKNGKEIGRVVEYGKYGMFDKELGDIINGK